MPFAAQLFPEVTTQPFSGRLSFSTLSELGMPTGSEAKQAGYFCVRAARTNGRRKRPGLWLPEAQRETMTVLVGDIAAHRSRVCEVDTHARQARLLELLGPFADAIDATRLTEAEAILQVPGGPDYLGLYRKYQKATAKAVRRFGAVSREGDHFAYQHRQPCELGGAPLRLRLSAEALVPVLLLQSDAAFDHVLENALGSYRQKRAQMVQRAGIPDWMPESAIARYAAKAQPATILGTAPMQRILACLKALPKTEANQFGLDWPEPVFIVSAPVTVGSDLVQVEQRLANIELIEQLNLATGATLSERLASLQANFGQSAQSLVEDQLLALQADLHEENARWAHLLTEAELLHLAKRQFMQALQRADLFLPHVGGQAYRDTLTELGRLEALYLANECRRQLPPDLPSFYPVARGMQRKLVLVIGPTNSGKTYRALERLRAATQTSVYLGPLRLLALEVRDRLQDEGIPISLVTGELLDIVPGAKYSASTIEMLNFNQPVEVALIDEVQMLGDPQRGAAWLQAVLGAPAQEVWMLGAPEVRPAIEDLAQLLGAELEIIETESLNGFEVNKHATSLANVPDQSAVIAFSRDDVLSIASELRQRYKRKVAVLYGALAPEVRREQARLFNEGEVDIVVATDAIGMGLNLPIEHILFTRATKWNGKEEIDLPADQVWQIAGRAGRYGKAERGHVGATDHRTLQAIQQVLKKRPPEVPSCFRYSTSWQIVEVLSNYLKTDKLHPILTFFKHDLKLSDDARFVPVCEEEQLLLASALDELKLPLKTRLALSQAPVPMVRKMPHPEFRNMARAIADKTPVRAGSWRSLKAEGNTRDQETAEMTVRLLTLYCWLHYRNPDIFPDLEGALAEIAGLNSAILSFLEKPSSRQCAQCRAPLTWQHPYRICDKCFQRR